MECRRDHALPHRSRACTRGACRCRQRNSFARAACPVGRLPVSSQGCAG